VVAHAVAGPVDLDDGGVVKEAVEHRCCDGCVLEDLPPAGDVAVGGQDDGSVLVAAADDLEEVGCRFARHREIAQLVDTGELAAQHSRIFASFQTIVDPAHQGQLVSVAGNDTMSTLSSVPCPSTTL
jgi:hypothetical protein